jgi:cytidine deaminase
MKSINKIQHTIHVIEYASGDDLPHEDADLLLMAREVTQHAYAPYSNFKVGAVARLTNGAIVSGTNQENASYPVGICAERVLLSSVSSQYPGIAINTIAVSYSSPLIKRYVPISPCGICRQTLVEYQQRFKQNIKLILGGQNGKVHIIENAADLLPFAFESGNLT